MIEIKSCETNWLQRILEMKAFEIRVHWNMSHSDKASINSAVMQRDLYHTAMKASDIRLIL
jgi:hypothetical protein